jgi:hypothetical protein
VVVATATSAAKAVAAVTQVASDVASQEKLMIDEVLAVNRVTTDGRGFEAGISKD